MIRVWQDECGATDAELHGDPSLTEVPHLRRCTPQRICIALLCFGRSVPVFAKQAQARDLRDDLQRLLLDPRMLTGPSGATGVVQSAFAKDVALFM